MPRITRVVSWCAVAVLLMGARPDEVVETGEALRARWAKEAAEYTLADGPSPLVRADEPALHWTNPVRKTDDGLLYVWSDSSGRPAAVQTFYRVNYEGKPTEAHEFTSLTTAPIVGTRLGKTVWSPPAGIAPKPIPGAPAPAGTPAERLRQVRALARDFRATVDMDKGPTALRLLSQPIARYDPASTGTRPDGALFAFVLATDPEAFLLIDERGAGGKSAWHYALARLSSRSLSAKLGDRVVWEVAKDPDDGNPAHAYHSLWDVGPRDPR